MILTCVGYPLGRLFSSRYHNVLWKNTPSVLDHRHVGHSLVVFSFLLFSHPLLTILAVPVSVFQLPRYFLRLMFEAWFDPFL